MPIATVQERPLVPIGASTAIGEQAAPRVWRIRPVMSRFADRAEGFLLASGFDRGPWLTVAFAAGIGLWFALPMRWQWLAVGGLAAGVGFGCRAVWKDRPDRTLLRLAVIAVLLAVVAGIAVVWARSAVVGALPIPHPAAVRMEATVLELQEQPSEKRVRIVVASRDPESGAAQKLRVNVPDEKVVAGLAEGARVRLTARLMPPAPPALPGAYDFARDAWFKGYAATGSLVGEITVVDGARGGEGRIASYQRNLARHVRSRLDGSPGTIAAAFASGDRGAIAKADEDAMRDAGLTHLLAISGLHVSALIGAAYFLAMRLLALWPWLTLRVRLPLAAACIGACAGVAYTLLTGAQVPTVRSCIGAILVLGALALGRDALSLRMIAVAAAVVLMFWPESLIGPSFQMSFSAVIAIVALHASAPMRAFLAPREGSLADWFGRRTLALFGTGVVIELALMPIVLFHFHKAGLYGAFANVIAIPLTTFVCMPLIALALFLDLAGLGAPVWRLAGKALELLLGIAHFTAAQPGAVKYVPQMGMATVIAFVAGSLWLALWSGRARLFGFVPIAGAIVALLSTPVPDLLITRDGKDVGLTDEKGRLFVLRTGASSYSRDNLIKLSGANAEPLAIRDWPGARCSAEFCSLTIERAGRGWHILIARNRQRIDERQLSAACERAHIVVADRWLPRSCKPLWLKADRRFLEQYGGTTVYLGEERLVTANAAQGDHGWRKQIRSSF